MMSTCVQCRAVSPCQTLAMRVHSSGYVREGAEEACSFGCGREPELVFCERTDRTYIVGRVPHTRGSLEVVVQGMKELR